MTDRDYYGILGVSRSASTRDIRAAFVRLVRQHHPDAAGALPQRLHSVQEAYRCLSDPEARASHDRMLDLADRHYAARQQRVRRRLRRYDLLHPRLAPGARYRMGWRSLLMIAVASAIAIIARLSFELAG